MAFKRTLVEGREEGAGVGEERVLMVLIGCLLLEWDDRVGFVAFKRKTLMVGGR